MCRIIEELYAAERLARVRLFRKEYPDSPDEMILIATGISEENLTQLKAEERRLKILKKGISVLLQVFLCKSSC